MNQTSILDYLYQFINVLPYILMAGLLIYFYSKKRIPGLLGLLIGYVLLTLVVIASTYGMQYLSSRFSTAVEMQKFYKMVGIVSMLAHLVTIAGMSILLASYPTTNDKQKLADNF